MIVVPYEQLSADALNGLISEFILREGTDYGLKEFTLDAKKAQILGQLRAGKVCVVYDPADESCSIVSQDLVRKHTQKT